MYTNRAQNVVIVYHSIVRGYGVVRRTQQNNNNIDSVCAVRCVGLFLLSLFVFVFFFCCILFSFFFLLVFASHSIVLSKKQHQLHGNVRASQDKQYTRIGFSRFFFENFDASVVFFFFSLSLSFSFVRSFSILFFMFASPSNKTKRFDLLVFFVCACVSTRYEVEHKKKLQKNGQTSSSHRIDLRKKSNTSRKNSHLSVFFIERAFDFFVYEEKCNACIFDSSEEEEKEK